jgi:imidazolonepropionase
MPDLLVRNCSQLVTLAGPPRPRVGAELRELAIIPHGAMLIRDGGIAGVGTERQVRPGRDIMEVDAGRRVVLPGFVDAHTHAVFAGNRADEFEARIEGATYEEIAARGGGIRATVRRTREASEGDLLAVARRYRSWFLRGGTTTVEAKSGYGLSLEAELKILRVIRQLGYVPTFLGAHEIPDEYRSDPSAYVDLIIGEMLPRVRAEAPARYCDVFADPSVFPLEQARAILLTAKSLGFGLRVHADQFRCDGAAQLAAEVGAATADHLEYTDEAGVRALAKAGVQPVLLPGSVYSLGSAHYPAARRLIELGLAIVLATDFNPGSSPTCSMPFILSLAATQMRITPAEAITATTINAAYSVGLGDEIGSLEPGKRADFVVHDCEDYRELPYFTGRETARAVYVEGRPVALDS